MPRLHTPILTAVCLIGLATTAAAAPTAIQLNLLSTSGPYGGLGTPTKSGKADQLGEPAVKQRLLRGTAGDWMFIGAGSGALTAGTQVRVGSDYSGHCITYKNQGKAAGINLGHVSSCNETKGGKNVRFELATGKKDGRAIRYGDAVAMHIEGTSNNDGYVCYGERSYGINLNWSKSDAACKGHKGSKGNTATQWKLMPPAGSQLKVGDVVPLDGRFQLFNAAAGDSVVKCARLTGANTWRAGDFKWRRDCQHYELIWTHRELVRKFGEDPKKLALDLVPSKYRKYAEMVM
jgi:hypothetical protein